MHIPKTSKNSEFLSSLIRKNSHISDTLKQTNNNLPLNETELKIEKGVFNNDMVLYAKSQSSKQK